MPTDLDTPTLSETAQRVDARYELFVTRANVELRELKGRRLTAAQYIAKSSLISWQIISDFVRDTPEEISSEETERCLDAISNLIRHRNKTLRDIVNIITEE